MRILPLLAVLLLGAQDPPRRDPTEADPALRQALRPGPPLPAVALRALVVAQGRAGSALVEIDGRLSRVEAGAVLGGWQVKSVTAGGVRLEPAAGGPATVLR